MLVPSLPGWKNALVAIQDMREKHDWETLKRIVGRHMLRGPRFTVSFQRYERLVDYMGNDIVVNSDLRLSKPELT